MTTYYTSDLHFGHQNILRYEPGRAFGSVEEMNEQLIANWNDSVKSGDTVWVLGDVAMGKIEESLACCARLNGTKILLCGNHDRPWAGWKHKTPEKREEWMRRYKDEGGFSLIYSGKNTLRAQLPGGLFVRMNHFPHSGDHTEQERYTQWRPEDDGGWLLHGHVHGEWQIRGRQVNVGVDVWNYRPVSKETLAKVILDHKVDTQ